MTEKTMRIRIGNQTAFSALTIMQPFEYAVDNGFDTFEWFPDKKSGVGWTESDISEDVRVLIKNTALAKDIRLSVHAPWHLNPLEPKTRESQLEVIKFAQDIGASLLNIHLYTDEGVAAYVEAIIPLVKHLAQVGIKLSIENTPDTRPEDFVELFRYLRKIGPAEVAHVGMCMDLGHANLCGATRNHYLKFIDMLDPQVPIIHIHMHENYGDYDSHLPLFTGPAGKDASGIIGLIERMKKRNFSGCIILEHWPQPEGLLKEARCRLLDIIINHAKPVSVYTDDFVNRIAEADRRFLSWRKKLGWIHDLFIDDTFDLNMEQLVYIAIYLRFIGTGEVSCSEDGGYHRPSHHAKMARRIYNRLSRITTPENAFIIRKIYPWLPSFDSSFTRPEPLTRIRDIAHRNDIPQELKREIKNTLQNKLHRSAGPEDLATSAALIERITVPGADYSPAFVEEFKKFHEELKEFFNARSLDEQLETIIKVGTVENSLVRDFFKTKGKADTPEHVLNTFELLTALRVQFNERLQGNNVPEAQQFQLTDIRLEDFSFVLLSQLINYFIAMNDGIPWVLALKCLTLTIENLRLSGFDDEECKAIESEMKVWSMRLDLREHEQLIRLKAALDRCWRLAEVYCNKILKLFPEKVERLGIALGVAEHAIKVYSESDIRSHPVFQLSKLVTILLKSIRVLTSLPLWDVIVPGNVSGRLVSAKCLDDLSESYDEPVLALLEKIESDEEIPAQVVGIIVAHEIPHLSHLAVRARRGNVVVVVCEDESNLSELKDLLGKWLIFDVSAKKVSLETSQPK